MGMVKNITIFSVVIAAIAGTVAKLTYKKKMTETATKKNVLSFLLTLSGDMLKMIGSKMKRDSGRKWKRVFMFS